MDQDIEELKRHIGQQRMSIDPLRGKTRPEIQIHMAVSLVMSGDPHGITKSQRSDKVDEVLQVAGRFPESITGSLTTEQIKFVVKGLTHQLEDALRDRGALKSGE